MSAQSDFKVFIQNYVEAVRSVLDEALFDNDISGKCSVNYQLPIFFDDKEYIVFVFVLLEGNDTLTSTAVLTQPAIKRFSADDIQDLANTHAGYINTELQANGYTPIPVRLPHRDQLPASQYLREIL